MFYRRLLILPFALASCGKDPAPQPEPPETFVDEVHLADDATAAAADVSAVDAPEAITQ